MPSTEKLARLYNSTDATLAIRIDTAIYTLNRDLSELAPATITAATITNLDTLNDDFKSVASDEEMIGQIATAVGAKENARDTLILKLERIRDIAQVGFSETPERMVGYRFDNLLEIDEKELLWLGQRVGRLATADQPELEDSGLTTAMVTEIIAKTTAFNQGLVAVEGAEIARGLKQAERIRKGNLAFLELKRICKLAYAFYREQDIAKLDDYRLKLTNSTPATPPDAPTIMQINTIIEMIFPQAVTRVRLRKSPTGIAGSFVEVYEGVNTPVEIGVITGVMFLEAEGRNAAGWGATGTKKIVVALEALAGATFSGGAFDVTPVPGAERLQIRYGAVGGSVDDPETIEVSDADTWHYVWTPPAGTYNFYFRAVAGSGDTFVAGPWLVVEFTIS